MVLLSDPGKFVPRLVANNHQTNIKNRRPYSTHYRQTIPEQRDRLANRLRVKPGALMFREKIGEGHLFRCPVRWTASKVTLTQSETKDQI